MLFVKLRAFVPLWKKDLPSDQRCNVGAQKKLFLSSMNWNKNHNTYTIRNAHPHEFQAIGKLMVQVYSQLEGFPKESEQPNYYKMLANVGELTQKPHTEILVAVSPEDSIAGAVVYFGDMRYYGSGGTATQEKNSAGFRLLAVSPASRGLGIGKLLTNACIQKTKDKHRNQLIIHTTKAMQTAWKMYEDLGFKRSEELDFMQGELPVFGFRLDVGSKTPLGLA